jgi:RHS repeat-associated protein
MPFNNGTVGAAGPSFNGSYGDVLDSHEYDALERELHPVQGRWIQPDPAGMAAVDPSNPQTWNRYAYVINNPLSFIDPSGLNLRAPCELFGNDGCDPSGGGGSGCDMWMNPLCGWGGGGPGWGGGGPGGGGGSGGSGGGGAPPSSGGSGSGSPVGNNLLGFNLFCAGHTVNTGPFPSPSAQPSAWNCALYFLQWQLGTLPNLVNGFIVAGTVTALFPIPQTGGRVAGGVAVPFAFSAQGFSCIGFGPAIGSAGKAFNVGPLTGNINNARNVLSGPSFSGGVQGPGVQGYQFVWNLSGTLFGPTVGTPGWSLAGTVSGCPGF